jgi:4-hydroxy-tetrahydrodipicolinate synthase
VNSQDELLDHYRAVRAAVDLPLLVYNIPQTVKTKLDVPTVLTLASEGTVVGIKDSQNDLDWFRQVMTATHERGLAFRGFLGTRILIDAGIVAGADGAIPGISNVVAGDCVAVYDAAIRGDWTTANERTKRVLAAQKIINLAKGSPNSSSFSGMKAMLKALGVLSSARVRLPLRTVGPDEEQRIASAVAEFGLPAYARSAATAPRTRS